MDNHPIPQDVTGFQFKLIGNMTVKQFAYLATGLILAAILFKSPINILIKFPFCMFSAILGIGLAYFPVSGRPMDLMIGNYIKALFRPTQFIYGKVGGQIYFPNRASPAATRSVKQYRNDFNPFPKDKLKAYLATLDTKPKNKVDEKEDNFLMSVSSLATSGASYQSDTSPDLDIPQATLQPNLVQHSYAPVSLDQSPIKTTTISPQPFTLATQPASPKLQQSEPFFQAALPTNPTIPQRPSFENQTKTAISIPKAFNRTIGMPSTPEFPNLIKGITRDARGNALSNILVEIKDKDGNPIRAFKTNELGRFASATPLANGTYTIEFEDPKAQNRFEKLAINVTGQIILPIEAVSNDAREELRRSLFSTGKQTN